MEQAKAKADSGVEGLDLIIGKIMEVPQHITVKHEDWKAARQRIIKGVASEQDKWTDFVGIYKQAWYVKRLDGSFLRENRIRPASPHVLQLMACICPTYVPCITPDETIETKHLVLRTPMIREVLTAMGLKSPFDTEWQTKSLVDLYEEKLKKTQFFREYGKVSGLFRNKGVTKTWCTRSILGAIDIVLGSMGMKLGNSIKKNRGKRSYTYFINPDLLAIMLGHCQLRFQRRSPRPDCLWEHAREQMELPNTKYGHLVN